MACDLTGQALVMAWRLFGGRNFLCLVGKGPGGADLLGLGGLVKLRVDLEGRNRLHKSKHFSWIVEQLFSLVRVSLNKFFKASTESTPNSAFLILSTSS